MKSILKKYPLFAFLLPIFFILHGYTSNYEIVPFDSAALLAAIYIAAASLFFAIFRLIYKNTTKAGIAAFVLLAFNFFFGLAQDFLKSFAVNSFFTKYIFLLPLSFILLVTLFIFLKKTKQDHSRTMHYLNWLFLLLILIDGVKLLVRSVNDRSVTKIQMANQFVTCDTCRKPDIYLIVADEYAGRIALNDLFNFDNNTFENELKNRGFHIIDSSRSNYNFSPFSIASLLNMDYLEGLDGSNTSSNDMRICHSTIKENKTFGFFMQNGYQLYNCSIFNLPDKPSVTKSTILNNKKKALISQTFVYRIYKDLGFHLAANLRFKPALENVLYKELRDNEQLYALTKETAQLKSNSPKFVYTHLLMPHYPYYYDSKGQPTPASKLTDAYQYDRKAYTEYLVYTNGKLLELIDHIKQNATRPPLIILLGDHGFRQFGKEVDRKYNFLNFNAVLLPGGNYKNYYSGMSIINQFRVILNSEFGQRLPLLNDATIYLRP